MLKNLYISHQYHNWGQNKSPFLTIKNYKKLLEDNKEYDVKFTCEDFIEGVILSGELLDQIFNQAKQIIVCGLDEKFLDVIPDVSADSYLYIFQKLKHINLRSKVAGFDWIDNFNLDLIFGKVNDRISNDPHLWITGCSITAGLGVTQSQSWPSILSKKLNLPLMLLAKSGSSIEWQAAQLLSADIRPGDIVIWGLTNFCRINFTNGTSWETTQISKYQKIPEEKQYWKSSYFLSPSLAYSCINDIRMIIKLCKSIGAKLYLVNLFEPIWSTLLFGDSENYLNLCPTIVDYDPPKAKYNYIDIGDDGLHPGPLQHQFYAEQVYNLIRK